MMTVYDLSDALRQAIIEAFKELIRPVEVLAESTADMMNDYHDGTEDIYYFDSAEAINKVSLLLMFLSLHKKIKLLKKEI